MKRKIEICAVLLIFTLGLAGVLAFFQYNSYVDKYNERLNSIAYAITEKYPQVTPNEIMEVFNSSEKAADNFFYVYGVDLKKDSVMLDLEKRFRINLIIDAAVCVVWVSVIIILFLLHDRSYRKNIATVRGYLEKINRGDYSFHMDELQEGEKSILESEVYKTTIMLRESAEQSRQDKENLKDSLSDISHQLKTPLTSLNINLDNLRDNPNLSEQQRNLLINNAKRDAKRMTQMVQLLLTLSRFDANVVAFARERAKLSEIVGPAVEDVSALADLKGIEILQNNLEDSFAEICCDLYWQTQAVANILKNGIEHADKLVRITYMNCELYKEIKIENDGELIKDEDREKLFERFYHGESSGNDSVGIGLSLANAIVKQDGGYIVVEADQEQGVTRFIIRYV